MVAKQTPLIDLLERVPADARMVYEHDQLHHQNIPVGRLCHEAAATLRAALEQPEQEPVAWRVGDSCWKSYDEIPAHLLPPMGDPQPLYTAPPRREWQSLTEEEIIEAVREADLDWMRGWTLNASEPNRYMQLARAIEAALREKNHG